MPYNYFVSTKKHSVKGSLKNHSSLHFTFITLLSKAITVHSGYTFVLSVCVFPGNQTLNLCAANAMLYHWATGTVTFL